MYQDVTNKWRWKGWGARETANIPKIILFFNFSEVNASKNK